MVNHPGRSKKLNSYRVRVYKAASEQVFEMTGPTADAVLTAATARHFHGRRAVSITSRLQKSPVEADRDNRHAQFDGAGRFGIAILRAEVDLAAAEHRNDVEVVRAFVARGRRLEDIQKYGAYSTVKATDL